MVLDQCQPNADPMTGESVLHGLLAPEQLWGPEGWCEAEEPQFPNRSAFLPSAADTLAHPCSTTLQA